VIKRWVRRAGTAQAGRLALSLVFLLAILLRAGAFAAHRAPAPNDAASIELSDAALSALCLQFGEVSDAHQPTHTGQAHDCLACLRLRGDGGFDSVLVPFIELSHPAWMLLLAPLTLPISARVAPSGLTDHAHAPRAPPVFS